MLKQRRVILKSEQDWIMEDVGPRLGGPLAATYKRVPPLLGAPERLWSP